MTWCKYRFILLVALASFATFVLVDPVNNILDSETAFVSLTLFNTMRGPLFLLPFGIVSIIQGAVSISRINTFLNLDELNPENVSTPTYSQNLHWKLGQLTPSFGPILLVRLKRSIFQIFWKTHSCPDFLFLDFKFCLLAYFLIPFNCAKFQ